jgi:uncharacterized repeat protein (TIGR01451 family)
MKHSSKKPWSGWTVGTAINTMLAAFLIILPTAQAVGTPGQEDKITICHATASHSNPYVVNQPDRSGDLDGHDNHNGPVWFEGITEDWGDIIPPFDYGDGLHYDGKNWTAEGQAILDNGCVMPSPPQPDTGTLVVQKIVSGGNAVASDFSLHVMSSSTDVSGSPQPGSGTGTSYTLTAGTYTISESGGPGDFDAAFSSECSSGTVTVIAGQSVTCTVTNTFNPPDENSIDIALTKTVDNNNPSESDNITYTIVAVNNGPHSASSVVVNDLLPSSLTFVSSVAGQGSFDSNTGVWTIGSLANGASANLTIIATVNTGTGGTTITNTAAGTAAETDHNPSNNSASVNVTVGSVLGESTIDLSVEKTVNDSSPQHNDNVTYTLTVTNNGPADATGVVLTDVLPSGATFVSSTTATGSFNSGTGAWTIGNLANGSSVTLSIIAQATAAKGTQVTNTATVTGTEDDSDLSNNTDTAVFTVPNNNGGGGGGGSSSGSRSSGNGQVLGESTEIPFTSISIPQTAADNTPAVLGESVELPRTGTPLNTWLLLFLLLSLPFALQKYINS